MLSLTRLICACLMLASPASVGSLELQQRVRALMAGELDVAIEPQSLFGVPLADQNAVRVEAVRLTSIVSLADAAAAAPASTKPRKADPAAAAASVLRHELENVDATQWHERLALDRTRLAFYSLPLERRNELLATHLARQEAARPKETDEERRERETQAERQRALDAAKTAHSEAERLVAEEMARLIALESRVQALRGEFREARERATAGLDAILGWQRRARDAKAGSGEDVDVLYDALRRTLRLSRDELAMALDALDDASQVPTIGSDALADVPPDVTIDEVRARRHAVELAIQAAMNDEAMTRSQHAAVLLDEITALNKERLGLLDHLSSAKRDAVTGFTAAGFDQARSELRHLTLILRYHRNVAEHWVREVRAGNESGVSVWQALGVAVPWLVLIVAFIWSKRRIPGLLLMLEARLRAADRAERRSTPSAGHRAVRVLANTHRPLEWIALFTAALWLMPGSARHLLEVELVTSAIGWILSGALIVNVINAIAANTTSAKGIFDDDAVGELRLRSLRLVGRTVVGFALVLVLSSRLVGQGTIYSWVFSTCWFASVPLFLLLVRWWRGTVFDRMDRTRKKTPVQAWVLANRSGWKSFFAAMIGALQLFASGAVKTVSSWLSSFQLARRVHAYLFKRGIERMHESQKHVALQPLADDVLEKLGPDHRSVDRVSSPSDAILNSLLARLRTGRGGLVAIVGARGMGKSSLLEVLAAQADGAVTHGCTSMTTSEEIRALSHPSTGSPPRLLLLDDAHALVKPQIDGLATFDDVMRMARGGSRGMLWVFALDGAMWPLLKRARDARPLFDETHMLQPWNETQIGALIAQRSASAGVVPTYDDLLDPLPAGSDVIDRQDALKVKQLGYERMLWDHVNGNPALALETWRASIACDENGVVHVRSLKVPDSASVEALPDLSLFILRAVLQLGPASVQAVAEATRLRPEEVLQEFRFGRTQGFFVEQDGHMRVAWSWQRPVTKVLERRHLLVSV